MSAARTRTAPRAFGWLPEAVGQHDELVGGPNADASDLLAGAAPTPSEFCLLASSLPAFKDQDITNTCVIHTICNVAEGTLKATSTRTVDPSSIPQLYATANALIEAPNAPLKDDGTYARVAMQAAKEWGVARDADWPFRDPRTGKIIAGIVTTRVPPDILQRASSWKLEEQRSIYAHGPDRLRTVETIIAGLGGVPTAFVVDSVFQYYDGRGVLGAPKAGDVRGRHMVAIVGYRTNARSLKREYLIANSWRAWGLVFQGRPSMAWVNEEWVLAQEEMYQMRVTHGRRTS